jgi:hypothetical protein
MESLGLFKIYKMKNLWVVLLSVLIILLLNSKVSNNSNSKATLPSAEDSLAIHSDSIAQYLAFFNNPQNRVAYNYVSSKTDCMNCEVHSKRFFVKGLLVYEKVARDGMKLSVTHRKYTYQYKGEDLVRTEWHPDRELDYSKPVLRRIKRYYWRRGNSMIVDKEDALLESTVAMNSSEYSRAKIRYRYDNISCDPLEAKRFLEKEIGDYFVRNYGTFLMEYYTICPPSERSAY